MEAGGRPQAQQLCSVPLGHGFGAKKLRDRLFRPSHRRQAIAAQPEELGQAEAPVRKAQGRCRLVGRRQRLFGSACFQELVDVHHLVKQSDGTHRGDLVVHGPHLVQALGPVPRFRVRPSQVIGAHRLLRRHVEFAPQLEHAFGVGPQQLGRPGDGGHDQAHHERVG